jgi:hypothetical protein
MSFVSDRACYAAGTRILTSLGEAAVETLAVGDLIVTASGPARPVKWLGHRVIDCTRHPDPKCVWPICVVKGAFGENQPRRELWLSPGHNVFRNGALNLVRKMALTPAHVAESLVAEALISGEEKAVYADKAAPGRA